MGIVDPLSNLNQYIAEWKQAQEQSQEDNAQLMTMLAQMLSLAKEGKVTEAFQVAEMCVMPSAMEVQGDTMGGLASAMNVSSALLTFTTDVQNNINAGTSISPEQAGQIVQYLQEVYNKLNDGSMPPGLLDPVTQANLINALDSISSTLNAPNGSTTPDQLNATQVYDNIVNWVGNPNQNPYGMNGPTGQQYMQDLQSGMTQWNNTESAQSQGLQAQEQFAANTYNQYMNACTDVFHSTQSQDQSMVQNQKSQ